MQTIFGAIIAIVFGIGIVLTTVLVNIPAVTIMSGLALTFIGFEMLIYSITHRHK